MKIKIKIHFLYFISLLVLFFSCNSQTILNDAKPNIILLLADDLGFNELGVYGQKIIKTPNLDKLARKGMMFTDFYSGNAACAPSRAVLMTGKKSSKVSLGILGECTCQLVIVWLRSEGLLPVCAPSYLLGVARHSRECWRGASAPIFGMARFC